jgi:hypothetical protein
LERWGFEKAGAGVIKFRVWDKKRKVMLRWHDDYDTILDILHAIPLDMGDEWTEQCEVMQFSGMIDKRNEEIYEDDLVKKEGGARIYKVTSSPWSGYHPFHRDSLHSMRVPDPRSSIDFFPIKMPECQAEKWEVVGNVYETSKLMKERNRG